jgi:hypothetical protein
MQLKLSRSSLRQNQGSQGPAENFLRCLAEYLQRGLVAAGDGAAQIGG